MSGPVLAYTCADGRAALGNPPTSISESKTTGKKVTETAGRQKLNHVIGIFRDSQNTLRPRN